MFNRTPPYSVEEKNEHLKTYVPFFDFFDENIFVTLTKWDGKDFIGHIKLNIEKAINYLNSKKSSNEYCRISKVIIPSIIDYYSLFEEVFVLSMEGKRSQAYKKLTNEIMTKTGMAFNTFRELTHRWDSDNETDYVFRMRYEKDVYQSKFKPLDLFHVPFEKRYLIGNNRFSLSGLPCLYFGNSIYCCWEEMNRPDLNNCFTSRFNLTGHHFIDLSISPRNINDSLKRIYSSVKESNDILSEDSVKSFEYLLDDYLRIWPLIFCCSIKTYHHTAVYKPEYIFPQLLMEWLISDAHNLYDGIKFRSTKEPLLEGRFDTPIQEKMTNYVIPARIVKQEGFCEESLQKLTITEPVNLLVEKLANNISDSGVGSKKYKDSIFGQLEGVLETKELKKST